MRGGGTLLIQRGDLKFVLLLSEGGADYVRRHEEALPRPVWYVY